MMTGVGGALMSFCSSEMVKEATEMCKNITGLVPCSNNDPEIVMLIPPGFALGTYSPG